MNPVSRANWSNFQDPLFYKKMFSSKPAIIAMIAIGIIVSLAILITLCRRCCQGKISAEPIKTSPLDTPEALHISTTTETSPAPPIPTTLLTPIAPQIPTTTETPPAPPSIPSLRVKDPIPTATQVPTKKPVRAISPEPTINLHDEIKTEAPKLRSIYDTQEGTSKLAEIEKKGSGKTQPQTHLQKFLTKIRERIAPGNNDHSALNDSGWDPN